MEQIKIPADAFSLVCYLTCETREVYKYPDESADAADYIDVINSVKEEPKLASKTVTFPISIPKGATVKSARVHATLGSPLYGAKTSRINGVPVAAGDTTFVDIAIEDGATSVEVTFQFLCNTPAHQHDTSNLEWADETRDSGLYHYEIWYFDHASSLAYTDIYLLIEYEGGAGYVHRAEGGKLVPYRLCRAEGGRLVPYRLHRAEGGKLVPY